MSETKPTEMSDQTRDVLSDVLMGLGHLCEALDILNKRIERLEKAQPQANIKGTLGPRRSHQRT